jgi:hypothetical protein
MIPGPRITGLLADLHREHGNFLDALEAAPEPESRRVVEDWDARDLVVHCAFWCDHGADAVELAASGHGEEFDYDNARTDAMNADAAAAGHETSLEDARRQEDGAYQRFRDAVAGLHDEALDIELGNGDTVEAVIRYDGADHYAEHAAQLREAASGGR